MKQKKITKLLKPKVRRGKRRSSKNLKKSMRFLGINAAGLKSKLLTFKKVLAELQPSVFFLQETKLKTEGQMKLGNNFIVFELLRQNRNGGGLAIGCAKDLNPVWVREGNDQVEALSVDIFLKNIKIRCCGAYGPQENDPVEKKADFWKYLDFEVWEASKAGAGFILQFDGNLWAGNKLVPGDPRHQNKNGKLFEEFLQRNPNLTVVNSLQVCRGLITRSRMKDGTLEESVLDFFVVCSLVLPFLNQMVIDNSKQHILTNYKKAADMGKAVDSDHYTEYMDLNLEVTKEKPERQELFNFKDVEAQQKFKLLTSETTEFTECFAGQIPLKMKVEKWRQILQKYCKKSFKKIRIKKNSIKPVNKFISGLINKRNKLVDEGAKTEEIEEVNKQIANFEADENRKKIIENFKFFSDNPENIQMQGMWKSLKSLCPKLKPTLPAAKRNHDGKIISGQKEIKNLLAKEYKNRLRSRPVRQEFKSTKLRRKKIFQMKMRVANSNKTDPWTMRDLERALSDLKNNKSRDFEGYINEIFKDSIIGTDLKKSILLMYNNLKIKRLIPQYMNFANITTIHKKGSKLDPKNERGIFRTPVTRYILMRLIYNSKYPTVDKNISDCQMGARKGKGCRNNIWIINGIIHESLKSKKMKPILLQIYDYKQMFDSINLEEAISDIYDYGLKDDTLALIHQANEEIHMSVKTPGGLTERQILKNIVLQGDTWGSILASVQVDSIGKAVEEAQLGYLYKGILPISFLGLVDDVIGVTEAGFKAQQLNAILNVKTSEKCLQYGVTKCKSMLVGKNSESIINTELLVDNWSEDYVKNIETGETELVEEYLGEVPIGQTKEYKYLGFVISSEGNNMTNINALKKKSIGVIRTIIQKLDALKLQKYYFECSIIFMNVMLRGSILYASETYYNLTELQLRNIERIEEGYLRQILKTRRGCPITQLYLETGQWPARFQIQKSRLLFLKTILEEDPESRIYKFFQLQQQKPTKGDWVSECKTDLEKLEINETFEEIKLMTPIKFKNVLKSRITKNALKYLLQKRGSKGMEIEYPSLEMKEYLLPYNDRMNIEEKQKMFEIRNRMVDIPANFGSNEICICGNEENMSHIYSCEYLNMKEITSSYEKIFNGNLSEQIEIFRRFENNLKVRNDKLPCDQINDPLNCVQYSIG